MGSAAAPRALSEGKPKLEIRNQKSEIRNQKSEIRNQKSEIRNQTEPARTTFREMQVGNQNQKLKTLELKTKN
jgi:hypothetical protein